MYNLGISGKLLRVIRSMYERVKSQVRHCNNMSDFIEVSVGLKQGEICSPLLWSIFIEGLEKYLATSSDNVFTIDELTLILLFYADDMVLLEEKPGDLQLHLNNLKSYCVFRRKGRIHKMKNCFIMVMS